MIKKKSNPTGTDSLMKERAKRVAYNLKRIRKNRGIKTVNQLLDLMGQQDIEINSSYMRRLESANAPFGSDMEQRFLQFYKIDVSEFYRPEIQTEKEREIDFIRDMLSRLDIEKVKRVKELLPVLFGGESIEEGSKDTAIPREKKTA